MLGKDVTPAITSCAHCLCIIIYIFVIFILQSSWGIQKRGDVERRACAKSRIL